MLGRYLMLYSGIRTHKYCNSEVSFPFTEMNSANAINCRSLKKITYFARPVNTCHHLTQVLWQSLSPQMLQLSKLLITVP
jgi:hypothetical protein